MSVHVFLLTNQNICCAKKQREVECWRWKETSGSEKISNMRTHIQHRWLYISN